jgi:hypothetical protein
MEDEEKLTKNIEVFIKNPDQKEAMKIGKKVFLSSFSLEKKRNIFRILFQSPIDDKTEAIINLWAVATMIEAEIPLEQKIIAARELIADPKVSIKMLEEWIRSVWKRRKAPLDFLEFIAIDLRNITGLSKDLKEILFDFSS